MRTKAFITASSLNSCARAGAAAKAAAASAKAKTLLRTSF
jgi:hypothetical protein